MKKKNFFHTIRKLKKNVYVLVVISLPSNDIYENVIIIIIIFIPVVQWTKKNQKVSPFFISLSLSHFELINDRLKNWGQRLNIILWLHIFLLTKKKNFFLLHLFALYHTLLLSGYLIFKLMTFMTRFVCVCMLFTCIIIWWYRWTTTKKKKLKRTMMMMMMKR